MKVRKNASGAKQGQQEFADTSIHFSFIHSFHLTQAETIEKSSNDNSMKSAFWCSKDHNRCYIKCVRRVGAARQFLSLFDMVQMLPVIAEFATELDLCCERYFGHSASFSHIQALLRPREEIVKFF